MLELHGGTKSHKFLAWRGAGCVIPPAWHPEQDANAPCLFVLQRHAGSPTPQSRFQRETEAGSSKAACWGGLEPQPCAHGFCTAVAWSSPTIAPTSSTPAKGAPWFTPQYPLQTWFLVWGKCRHLPGVIPPIYLEQLLKFSVYVSQPNYRLRDTFDHFLSRAHFSHSLVPKGCCQAGLQRRRPQSLPAPWMGRSISPDPAHAWG